MLNSNTVFGSQIETKYKFINSTNNSGVVAGVTRSAPIYESQSDASRILGYVFTNQIIRVTDYKDDYSKIRFGSTFGYVPTDALVVDNDLVNLIVHNSAWFTKTVKIVTDTAQSYDWISGNPFTELKKGDSFQLRDLQGDYYVAIYTVLDDLGEEQNTLINIPVSSAKIEYNLKVTSFSDKEFISESQADLIDYACSFVGCPYVWGGNDPHTGADCSGFVKYVYNHFGYELPRCSWEQATVGTEVSLTELQPGDLIFYNRGERIGHVTMYIGDGQCVQARGSNYNICITRFDYSTPCKAVRILGED